MSGLLPSHTISDVRNGAIPFLPFLEGGPGGRGNRVSVPRNFVKTGVAAAFRLRLRCPDFISTSYYAGFMIDIRRPRPPLYLHRFARLAIDCVPSIHHMKCIDASSYTFRPDHASEERKTAKVTGESDETRPMLFTTIVVVSFARTNC